MRMIQDRDSARMISEAHRFAARSKIADKMRMTWSHPMLVYDALRRIAINMLVYDATRWITTTMLVYE